MSDGRGTTPVGQANVSTAILDQDGRPTLVTASLASAKMISDTMTGVIQPQINTHSAAITAAQALINTQGEAIAAHRTLLDTQGTAINGAQALINTQGEAIAAQRTLLDTQGTAINGAQGKITAQGEAISSARTRLDAQHETLAGMQSYVTRLGETTTRHEQAITFALLGEEGHIRRHGLELAALAERVWRLEHPDRGGEPTPSGVADDQAREMRVANEALRERVEAMEGAIRQLLEHGPQGTGSRSSRPR